MLSTVAILLLFGADHKCTDRDESVRLSIGVLNDRQSQSTEQTPMAGTDTQIYVSYDVRDVLHDRKRPGDSYNDVLVRLLERDGVVKQPEKRYEIESPN